MRLPWLAARRPLLLPAQPLLGDGDDARRRLEEEAAGDGSESETSAMAGHGTTGVRCRCTRGGLVALDSRRSRVARFLSG